MKHLTIKQRRILFPFLVLGVVFCFCRMRVKWRKSSFCDLVSVLVLMFSEAFFFPKNFSAAANSPSSLLHKYTVWRLPRRWGTVYLLLGAPLSYSIRVTTWLSWVWYKSPWDWKGHWQQREEKTCNPFLNCPLSILPTVETGFQLHSCCGLTKLSLWPEEAQNPCLYKVLPSPSAWL